MAAPRILELNQRGAVASAPGVYTCEIDGGLTLDPGGQFQVLQTILNQPGASAGEGSIEFETTQSVTLYFYYWLRYMVDAANKFVTPYDAQFAKLDTADLPIEFGTIMFANSMGNPVTTTPIGRILDRVTITVPAGSYTPSYLATFITGQLRQAPSLSQEVGAQYVFGEQWVGESPNGYSTVASNVGANYYTNFPTFRTALGPASADTGPFAVSWLASADQVTKHTPVVQKITGSTYYLGASSPTLIWLADEGRFQFNFHTSFTSIDGSPVLYRCLEADPTVGPYIGGYQGCAIVDWGVTQANWASSLYPLLGFQYEDLQGLVDANPDGVITFDVVTPAVGMISKANTAGVCVISNTDTIFEVPTNPATGGTNTNGPVASLPPNLGASVSSYWRVEVSVGPTAWSGGDGARLSNVYALANRSYPSGDLFISDAGPMFPVLGIEPRAVGSLQVRFIDSSTGEPDTSLGQSCSVLCVYYPPEVTAAPVAPPDATEKERRARDKSRRRTTTPLTSQ